MSQPPEVDQIGAVPGYGNGVVHYDPVNKWLEVNNDPTLITAAMSAAYNSSAKGVAARLQRGMNTAKNNNPYDLGVDSAPPTVTWTATPPGGGYTEYNLQTLTDAGAIRFGGAPQGSPRLFVENSALTTPVSILMRQMARANDNGRIAAGGGFHLGIRVPSPVVFLRAYPYVVGLRVCVNGKWSSLAGTATTAANQYLKIDFSALGTPRIDREIIIEGAQGQLLISIFLPTGDQVSPLTPYPLTFGITGDSYCDGAIRGNAGGADATNVAADAGNVHAGDGLIGALRYISGCNIIANASQGTGWQTTASNVGPYSSPYRLTDLAAGQDFHIITGGINDINAGTTRYDTSTYAFRDAVQATLAAYRTKLTCPILVYTPFPANKNDSGVAANLSKIQMAEDDVMDAISRFGDSTIVGIPINRGTQNFFGRTIQPYVQGGNYQNNGGAGTAGNAYYVMGTDVLHLTPYYGTQYLARRMLDDGLWALGNM